MFKLPGFMISEKTTASGKTVRHLRWYISFILSMALAIGTWNPTGHHFIHYLTTGNPLDGFRPFFILMMIAFWLMAFKAVYQSLKLYGALILVLIMAAFFYGLHAKGVLDVTDTTVMGWLITITIGLVIFAGMNASIIWKTMTGVYTTDATEEG